MSVSQLSHLAAPALLWGLLASSVGCSTLSALSSAPLLPTGDKNAAAEPASQGRVVVQFREDGKIAKMAELPLQGTMHAQDAVTQSRANRKYRRIHVAVHRNSPEGRRHKMTCRYDIKTQRISPETDYALQPGDLIVVEEDPSNMFTDMLGSAYGPLKRLGGR